MADEPLGPDLRALWQHQRVEGGGLSAAAVRQKSEALLRQARRRMAVMYAAFAGNAGLPLVLMWYVPELRLALAWLVVTAVVLMTYVRRRSEYQSVAPGMTPAQGLAFYQHLLERERDFRRDSTRWFTIGPALNIIVLGLVYVTSPLFHGTTLEIGGLAAILVTHIVVLARVAQRLREEMRRSQRELEALAGLMA